MPVDRSKVLQQAQLLASKGQFDQAIAEWKKVVADSPQDGGIYNSIGDLYLKKNAVADAIGAFLQAAHAFKAEGATIKAIAAYKKVLKCDPARHEIYSHLGDLNVDRGLVASAVQDYLVLAKYYLKEGKPNDALKVYQKIVSHDPSNLDAQQRIAELCVRGNQQAEATKVYLQLGRECSAQGRYEEAKDAYLAVLRVDPKNAEAAQFVEGLKKGATGSIKPIKSGAASSEPQSSEPLGALVEAVRRMDEKQYDGAEAILNQMLSREPGNPQVCQLLARLHLLRGDAERGDLQVALGEYRFLAGAAMRAHDLLLAESLIEEFLAAQPDSVPLLELSGELCEEKKDPAAAAKQYARAVELLLVHPEPGMEGLHVELFEKVRSLSPDEEFVTRLAARMKGEVSADSANPEVPDNGWKPGAVGQPGHLSGSNAESGLSATGAEPDDPRPKTEPPVSVQVPHFSVEGAEPDGLNAFEKKRSANPDSLVLTNAEPDGANPFEVKTSTRSLGFVLTNAAPDGEGFHGMNEGQKTAVNQAPQEKSAEVQRAASPPVPAPPPPDYEAHFTLGLAFKDMGLYSEAREEFEIARTGDACYLDSSLMASLCDKEEGHLAQAVQRLEEVLSNPRCQGAKGQAIRYELGLLYEAQAQWGKAIAVFQAIPAFHDVPQRVMALQSRHQSSAGHLRLAG